jgi:uncharacterized membrane protein YhaH (DUF805 family)
MTFGQVLFGFSGRISRKTYWLAVLPLCVVAIAERVIPMALGPVAPGWRIVFGLVGLGLAYVTLAVSAKRWHDRDKSAWWVLLGFVPIVGQIWSLVELGFLRGTPGANRFGPATTSDAAADLGLAGAGAGASRI